MVYEKMFGGMMKAAETKGWKLSPPSTAEMLLTYQPVTVSGDESGIRVELSRYSSLHTFATMAFIEPALPKAFVITSEGVTGKIAHSLGIHDVEIGDADFDAKFRLVSEDPESLKRLLTKDVQAVLKELATAADGFGAHFRVTDKLVWMQLPQFGLMTEEETLRDIPLIVRVARTIKETAATVFG